LAGFLFDKFPLDHATKIFFAGKALPLHGYLISFEITAISFILSGYVLYFFEENKNSSSNSNIIIFLFDYLKKIKSQFREFFNDKYLSLLLIASAITGVVQLLGNSYYGIFIYDHFKNVALGGFVNVAIILFAAIIVSFLGPAFSKYLNSKVGLAPALVFGSLLLALMPLVSAFNPEFMNVAVANTFSVLGAAILGAGQGLLVRKLLSEEQRKTFFASLSIMVIIPFIIMIPIGSWIAQSFGLFLLFKILAFTLIIVVAPIYFVLVLLASKARL
jgi:MFS family permease